MTPPAERYQALVYHGTPRVSGETCEDLKLCHVLNHTKKIRYKILAVITFIITKSDTSCPEIGIGIVYCEKGAIYLHVSCIISLNC